MSAHCQKDVVPVALAHGCYPAPTHNFPLLHMGDCSATDWIRALSSIVIGAAAAVLAWWADDLAKQANNLATSANSLTDAANNLALAGIRPYMLVQTSNGRLFIKAVLKNDGAGPAIIDSVTCTVSLREAVTDTKAAQDADPDKRCGLLDYDDASIVPRHAQLADLLDSSEPTDNDIGYNIAGDAIGAGQELGLLACKVRDTAADRAFLNSIRALLDGAIIKMTYTDARDGPTTQAWQLVHSLLIPFRS